MKELLSSHPRIAIVGLAKNVGKTTTFNWLVEEGVRLGHCVGLASIGVDGEKQDVWDLHAKPAIDIKEGMWAATAKAALVDSTARFRIVEELKSSSPMGPVYLLESVQGGQMKLAGTQMNEDILLTLERFTHYGVTLSFVDGAYDRLASAQSRIVEGCILCTGASLDPHLEVAVKKTEEMIIRWKLPLALESLNESERTKLLEEMSQKVMYQKDGEWISLDSPSLLSAVDIIRMKVAEGIESLSIPGALTEWVMGHFISSKQPFTWVIEDPTKIFISRETMQRWFRAGGEIQVRRKSELLALSVNPFSTMGIQDSDEWLYAMKKVAGPIPVLDALRRKII